MAQTFLKIFEYFHRHTAKMYVLLALCILLLAGGFFLLRFDEDVSGFLTTNPEQERVSYAYQNIGGASKIIINISMADEREETDRYLLMEAADHLAALLEEGAAAEHIKDMRFRVDPLTTLEVSSFVTENMPYFLEEKDYERLDSLIQPAVLQQRLEYVKDLMLSPSGMILRNTLLSDPLLFSGPLLEKLAGFRLGDHFVLYSDYIFSSDGKDLVLTIDSRYPTADTGNNKQLIRAIDRAIEETEVFLDHQIKAMPFGAAYIALSNASQIKKDTGVSVGIALVVIGILLALYFRNIKQILLIGISILGGLYFALSLAGFLTPSVSLIAIGASSVILGIAVNYPLHFMSHIKEGYGPRQTLIDIVSPLTTGNITTIGAFLSLLFISSGAMRSFGLFASLLLLGTILFVLLFLPHMIGKTSPVPNTLHFGKLANSAPEQNKWVVGALVLLTFFFYFSNKGVVFNANMQSINYMTPDQKNGMQKLLDRTQGSQHVMYFVAEGETLDEALERYETALPYIDTFHRSGIGGFLPSRAMREERIARWNNFWSTRREVFLEQFNVAVAENGFREHAFRGFEETMLKDFPIGELQDFAPITDNLAASYLSVQPQRNMVYTMLHIKPEEAAETENHLNKTGPSTFAFDVGSVTRMMIDSLSSDFDYVLYICGFIVFLFLTLSFGRLELSTITFLPLAISWIWILGIMSLFGLEFNIVNIILATFIFGMGDDYTIFITEGMIYEYAYGKKMLHTYKNTVALSSLIMLTGIGSLILAKHPAMRSLAEITIAGMVSVVVTAYIVPPYLFRKLVSKRGKRRKAPLTIKNMAYTIYGFTAFLIGVVFLTLAGVVLLVLGRRSEKNKLRFHKTLQAVCRLAIYHVPGTTMQLLNLNPDGFEKPSVIVANHQSYLDLMAIIMLHPKIVIMTNQREWNSPFYRIILRFADFLPIKFIHTHKEKIQDRIANGYSVMVFPEGTRSPDSNILRFHKGAFHLAAELNLDITPVLLHGFGYVLPKENMLLRKGIMTVKILPRIKADDTTYGTSYQERTKAIRQLFVKEYERLGAEIEDAHYYASQVLHNYMYKGKDVYKSVRRSMQDNNNFIKQIETLPYRGTHVLEDRNFGEYALTAALVRKNLKIKAYLADKDKRELAAYCASVPVNLTYIDEPETHEQ